MRVNGLKGRLWAKTGGIILLSVLSALDAVVLTLCGVLFSYNAYFDGGDELRRGVKAECAERVGDELVSQAAYLSYKQKQTRDEYFEAIQEYIDANYPPESANAYIRVISEGIKTAGSDVSADYFVAPDYSVSVGMTIKLSDLVVITDPEAIRSFLEDYEAGLYSFYDETAGEWVGGEEIMLETEAGLPDGYYYDFADESSSEINLVIYENEEDRLSYYIEQTLPFTVEVAISDVMINSWDGIYASYRVIEWMISIRSRIIVYAVLLTVSSLIIFIFLVNSAGYNDRQEGVTLAPVNKIPLELLLGAAAGIFVLGLLALGILYNEFVSYDNFLASYGSSGYSITLFDSRSVAVALMVIFAVGLLLCMTALLLIMSIAARLKCRSLLKYTITIGGIILIFKLLRRIFRAVASWFKEIKYSLRVVIFVISMTALGLLALVTLGTAEFIALYLVCAAMLCVYLLMLGRIKRSCSDIAKGKVDSQAGGIWMPKSLSELSKDIDSMRQGIKLAVEEMTRSERMKTELITNVSHDLKTPLTSIVNYVNLLSAEDIRPERAKEYVDVLVRQSNRMKKLVEDLVEVSKASSGAIAVELEQLDMSIMLSQVLAEYSTRLRECNIAVLTAIPEKGTPVMADGRLMWRVFDNLLGNICKYAMPGTRVYIRQREAGGGVEITFSNISRYPLDISGKDLTERFVRGDASRHSEGSGLGLSIVKSLLELQGIGFKIVTDGDLFKAYVIFPGSDGRTPPQEDGSSEVLFTEYDPSLTDEEPPEKPSDEPKEELSNKPINESAVGSSEGAATNPMEESTVKSSEESAAVPSEESAAKPSGITPEEPAVKSEVEPS